LFCFGFVLSITAAVNTGTAASNYSESYVILIKGATAGNETVTEKPDASGDLLSLSDHEILVAVGLETKQMKFSTRMVLAKNTGIPVTYSYWYTSGNTGDSYDVTIKNGQITRVLNRGGRTSEVTVPLEPGMVFVDFNVYHQYDYLVRRYDFKKGGRQTFADFIPVIGNDIPVALTYLGEEKLDLKPGPLQIRNFRIEFVGIWGGMLSVNKEGRLVRLVIPTQDLEVLRRDLLPQ
jgi:hypothetical protein